MGVVIVLGQSSIWAVEGVMVRELGMHGSYRVLEEWPQE